MASINRSTVTLLAVPAGSQLSGAATYYPTSATPNNTVGNTVADLPTGTFSEVALDLNLSALTGTTPTVDVYLDRKGADGVYYQIFHATQLTAAGTVVTSVGMGAATNHSCGLFLRLRIVVGGTSPLATFSASVVGK